MQDVNITEARARLGELADQVKYTGEMVMLLKNGKRAAALVPAHVAEQWDEMRSGDFKVLTAIWDLNLGQEMTDEESLAWAVGAVHQARREIEAERAQVAQEASLSPSSNGQE